MNWVIYISQTVQSPDFINNHILEAKEIQCRRLSYPQWGCILSRQAEFSSHAAPASQTPTLCRYTLHIFKSILVPTPTPKPVVTNHSTLYTCNSYIQISSLGHSISLLNYGLSAILSRPRIQTLPPVRISISIYASVFWAIP